MKTLKGDLVAALYRVRLGKCATTGCQTKTRMGFGVLVTDAEGLVGTRICARHLEAVVNELAGVKPRRRTTRRKLGA